MFIIGNYRKEIFSSTSGYTVGVFKVTDTETEELANLIDRTITFTGYFHELNEQDTYKLYGKMVHHEKYGEQFQVDSYERVTPKGKDSIIEFLTSGLFKGIGEKKAKAIVDVLGDNTFKVILEEPSNLILIPGITEQNKNTLHSKLKEYESSYEIVMYLGNLGFNTKDSIEIYNKYKDRTKKIIEEDIYQVILDFNNIYYKKVDTIAISSGIEKDSMIRIKASIYYVMNEVCFSFGHTYLYKEEIVNYLKRLLRIPIDENKFNESIKILIKDELLVIEEDRYYLKTLYDSENLIARRFKLLAHEKPIIYKDIDDKLNEISSNMDILYNEEQLEAIKSSMENKMLVITGGPGTGKTTLIKAIIELYRELNKYSYEKLLDKVVLLAPTGRAAKRMSEETSLPASTIHRFLKWQKETNTFGVNEYHKSKCEFVIIDEVSMVDIELMSSLLKGISVNTKIILVGDDEQLPSVAPGEVLHDIIESNIVKTIKLRKLYRQGKDSNIIKLAYDIREENLNKEIFNKSDDLTFIETSKVMDNIKEIANTYKDMSYKDFQILVPIYKGLHGIDAINKEMQSIFNPKDSHKKEINIGETLFREEDKVIQLTNQPEDNIYNGDIGIISRIVTSPKKEIYIDFDNNLVKYTPTNFSNFRLAYAISIHKSQGSEFKVVIMPLVKGYNKMLYKKLVYTGVTRTKETLYLIGEYSSLQLAVKNNIEGLRRTTLKNRLLI